MLECAADTAFDDLARRFAADVLATVKHLATRDRQHSGHQVEGGRLARAIGANQADDLAGFHLEADIVHGNQAAKLLARGTHVEDQLTGLGLLTLLECRCVVGCARRRRRWKQLADERPDAITRVLQQQHQQHAEHDDLEVAVGAQQLRQNALQAVFQDGQQTRAKHRAPHVAHATDHRHEQVFDTVVQAEWRRVHRALQMRIEKARNARQHRRKHEDHHLHPCGVHPHRLGHRAAALERADGAAWARIQQVLHRQHRHDNDGPDQVEHLAAGLQRFAEHVQHRNAVQPVVLAQEFQVAEQEEERQAPRNRRQRQVVA